MGSNIFCTISRSMWEWRAKGFCCLREPINLSRKVPISHNISNPRRYHRRTIRTFRLLLNKILFYLSKVNSFVDS